jgi:polysaccharide export outer membrane protein
MHRTNERIFNQIIQEIDLLNQTNMKNYLFLLMMCLSGIAITSCSPPEDIIYFQDLTTTHPIDLPEIQYVRAKHEDKLLINVHCRDEKIAKLFNVMGHGYYGGGYSRGGGGMGVSTDLHTYNVDVNGDIEFPVVGTIHVGGLTRQEIADRVRNILIEENLVKDPYVSCSFANDYFYTLGEMGTSIVQIPKDAFTIIEAVAQSGDLTINAERRKIRVIREVSGQLRNYEVDFTSAESVVNSPVYYIQQGDIIYAEMDEKKQYSTTLYGNTVRKPTFWMSLISSILTFCLTIYAFARRFD